MNQAGEQEATIGPVEEAEILLGCEAYWRLTPGQRLFVDHLLADPQMNQTDAYFKAYPKSSREAARRNASRLMAIDDIRQALGELKEHRNRRLWLTQDAVLQELINIAFADMGVFVKWGPDGVELVESAELPPGASRVVSEVAQQPTKYGNNVKLKLHDKEAALKLLGQHLGTFKDQLEITGSLGLERRLAAAEKRIHERRSGS